MKKFAVIAIASLAALSACHQSKSIRSESVQRAGDGSVRVAFHNDGTCTVSWPTTARAGLIPLVQKACDDWYALEMASQAVDAMEEKP